MKITFNELGIVTSTVTNDEPLRQGNTVNTLKATFQGIQNTNYSATLSFLRSDGEIMSNVYMTRDSDNNSYKYTFSNPWFFAKAGATSITVYLKQNGATIASGTIQFNIEPSAYEDDPTITESQYQALIDSIADLDNAKLDKNHGIQVVDFINDVDLSEYNAGDLLYCKETNLIYRVATTGPESDPEYYYEPYVSVVYLPSTSSTGNLTDEQYLKLVFDPTAVIEIGGEIYSRYYRETGVGGALAYIHRDIVELGNNPGELRFQLRYVTFNLGERTYTKGTSYLSSYTKLKIDTLLNGKADKTGPLPFFRVNDTQILSFIETNGLNSKPFTFVLSGVHYLAYFYNLESTYADFEVERFNNAERFEGHNIDLTNITFLDLVFGSFGQQYRADYELAKNKTTSLSAGSTDEQYPSAKAVHDANVLLQQGIDASGHSIVASIDTTNYVLSIQLKDANGNNLGTAQTVDLPLESVVVGGTYDDTTETVILTLQNGSSITIPVHDLVDGFIDTTTFNNEMALKADKVGPLPSYLVSASDNVLTFVNSNNLSSKPIVLKVGEVPYFATFTITEGGASTSFEIERCDYGANSERYAGSFTSDLTFDDLISSSYRRNYEEKNYKVSSFGVTPNDTNYPSEKAVYDLVKKTGLPYFEVDGNDSVYSFFDAHSDLNGKPIIIYTVGLALIGAFYRYQPTASYYQYDFELEHLAGARRWYAFNKKRDDLSLSFGTFVHSSTYRVDYALESYVDSQNALNEKLANKKTTLTDSDTDYPTTRAVKSAIDEIRAVAEGKTQAFILSYNESIDTAKAEIVAQSANQQGVWRAKFYVYNTTSNQFEDKTKEMVEDREYDYLDTDSLIKNGEFNNNNNDLTLTTSVSSDATYLILRSIYPSEYLDFYLMPTSMFVGIVDIDSIVFPKRGDIIIVKETDVPDRWIALDGTFKVYALESKVNLTNYATKDQAFNVINASDITTTNLTDDQVALFTNGRPTLIKGTLLSYDNPILLPPTMYGTSYYYGMIVVNGRASVIGIYQLNIANKIIDTISSTDSFIQLRSINQINGKGINYYKNNVYPYATNSTTELKYETINNISISADTTFTLQSAPSGTYPEYKANITNTDNANAITITLPSGTIIKAESGITVSSNTFEIPADTTIILSVQDDLALVMIKG